MIPLPRSCVFLLAALSFLAVLPPSFSMAQSAPKSDMCGQAVTTADMRTCANARYLTAQADLRTAYNKLLDQLPPSGRTKLSAAELAWTRFRDANAAFVADTAAAGTLEPLLRVGALTETTEARTAELQKMIQNNNAH